jgi:hypothetical protein
VYKKRKNDKKEIKFIRDIYEVDSNSEINKNIFKKFENSPDIIQFGAVHNIYQRNLVRTNVGIFKNKKLDGFGRIFENNRLIYEGNLLDGDYDDIGSLRQYIKIPKKYFDETIPVHKTRAYIQYQGEFYKGLRDGNGTLEFIGNLSIFKNYFQMLLKKNISIKMDDIFDSKAKVYSKGKFFDILCNDWNENPTKVSSDSDSDTMLSMHQFNLRGEIKVKITLQIYLILIKY